MFKKILIANRGEIALRVIRTCREMGIKTVAVYSTADKDSLHVKFADEAVCIGPPPSKDSYLSMSNIIAAAEITNADAIHPGYGFLSENAKFSEICRQNNIKFIGASPEMINQMGDKSNAKSTMIKSGVPCVPGSEGLLESVEEGIKLAKEIKYPVIIKATAGGGGKGMRIIWKEEDFQAAWDSATHEASAAFGNGAMYMEKYIEEPRHIEIQIVGDAHGKACHLSERDCSVQRRHQKLVEETPSPFMTPELREAMGDAAVKAALSIGYEGVGTEEVINYDLVREQILVAAGVPISGKNYYPQLHAIECRINAENPFDNFKPSPGKITTLHTPGGHGIRVDSHVYSGYSIPPNYDSMIGKLITVAQTREEAIAKMRRALSEYVIEGIKTTIPFHIKLMNNEDFIAGNYTTKFMETWDFNKA
jgi:acetyl-CoA carboxylase biotin carboxylase subunit